MHIIDNVYESMLNFTLMNNETNLEATTLGYLATSSLPFFIMHTSRLL